jgi:hypothetical protein
VMHASNAGVDRLGRGWAKGMSGGCGHDRGTAAAWSFTTLTAVCFLAHRRKYQPAANNGARPWSALAANVGWCG